MVNELVKALPGAVGIFKYGPPLECQYCSPAIYSLGKDSLKEKEKLIKSPALIEKIIPEDKRSSFDEEVISKLEKGLPVNATISFYTSQKKDDASIG